MNRGKIQRIEVTMDELEAIVERAQLSDDDREKLQAALETLALLTNELETKGASIRRLRKLLNVIPEVTRRCQRRPQRRGDRAVPGLARPGFLAWFQPE